MGRTTNAVVCSYTTLCEITGVSRPTVGRAIKLLKDDQWIDTVKIGNANAYCVNERCSGKLEEIKENTRSSQQQLSHLPPIRRAISRKAKQKLTYIPIIESSDIPRLELTNYRRQTRGSFVGVKAGQGRVSGASEPLTGGNDPTLARWL